MSIQSTRRMGVIHPFLVFSIVVFLAVLALAVNHARLWAIRVEVQNNADADAAAAIQFLVGDDFLRGILCDDSTGMPNLLAQARQEAIAVSMLNPVNGRTFQLMDNPLNLEDGDIIFGKLDQPLSKNFMLPGDVNDSANKDLLNINTVRINAILSDQRGNAPGLIFPNFTGVASQGIRARGSATLDRDVVGFRHVVQKPIPIAGLAFRGDCTNPAPNSWPAKIEDFSCTDDNYRFDPLPAPGNFVMANPGDGIEEFEALLALTPGTIGISNTVATFIGVPDYSGLNDQLLTGVTVAHLAGFPNGALVLNELTNKATLPGDNVGPSGAVLTDLISNLTTLQNNAEIRIFPLYDSVSGGGGGKTVEICGFVAARVVTVENLGTQLRIRVQPTMIAINSAVTNANQRLVNGIPISNRYILKVRFVE